MAQRHALLALLFSALLMLGAPRSEAAVIFSGTPTTTSLPTYTIPADTFLLPVRISGALNVQSFQFDVLFDQTVVQVVDPFDGSSGLYGAQFTVGEPNSISFILGGFPFNGFGFVDDVAGLYPSLLDGVSGDGILAYVLFAFIEGQENNDPGFGVTDVVITSAVPEPATIALCFGALLLLTGARVVRAGTRCRLSISA